MIGTSPEAASLTCTGSLSNIVQYAKASFRKDQDQEKAFIQITAAFVLKLHEKCYNDLNHRRGRGVKRNRNRNAIPQPPINFQNNEEIKALREIMNNKEQFICFLSGAGGTGKSKVIQSVRMYCKQLCQDTLEIMEHGDKSKHRATIHKTSETSVEVDNFPIKATRQPQRSRQGCTKNRLYAPK